MSLFEHLFIVRISANPFLLHSEAGEGIIGEPLFQIFKFVRWEVFEIQRSVSQWYLDFI